MKRIILIFTFFCSVAAYAQPTTSAKAEPGISDFPNYHPLIVHFPIILLLVAAAMQIGLLFFRNNAYNYAVTILTVIGFITALLAVFVFHAHAAKDVNPTAMEIFEEHERLAYITLWISGFAAAFKVAGLFIQKKWVEIFALLLLVGSAITVSLAGHHGSELVYKQGIGPKGEKLEKEEH